MTDRSSIERMVAELRFLAARKPLRGSDLKRAKELMNYPWFRQSKEWMRQLKLFLQRQEKVEIEALSGHGFKFLTERYIPEKLSSGKWIE